MTRLRRLVVTPTSSPPLEYAEKFTTTPSNDGLMIMITNMPQVLESETFWQAALHGLGRIYFHIIHSSPGPIHPFWKCEFLRIIIVWLLVLYIYVYTRRRKLYFSFRLAFWGATFRGVACRLFIFSLENRLINLGRKRYKRCAPSQAH